LVCQEIKNPVIIEEVKEPVAEQRNGLMHEKQSFSSHQPDPEPEDETETEQAPKNDAYYYNKDKTPEPEPEVVVDTCETPPNYTTTG
jgi:hypothetical protein